MTQVKMKLRSRNSEHKTVSEAASSIGLSWTGQEVVLRFMPNESWGGAARQVKIDQTLAEQLSQLLNYELDSRRQEADIYA